jgi:hypothetical protein
LAARLVRRGHRVRVLADPTVHSAARAAGCAFTSWKTAPNFATVAEQTALIRAVERAQCAAAVAFAQDRIICGPAGLFAADVVSTVREHPVDVVLAGAAVAGALIGA